MICKKLFIIIVLIGSLNGNVLSADYFPLEIGYYWVGDIIDSNGITIGVDSVVIESTLKINNNNYYLLNGYTIKNNLYDTVKTEVRSFGNDIYMLLDDSSPLFESNSQIKLWQHEYTNGEFWVEYTYTIRVEYMGTVQVPAGIFDSCYLVKIDAGSGWVFAPDVGAIKTILDGKDAFVLTEYNLNFPNKITQRNEAPAIIEKLKVYPNPFNSSTIISFQFTKSFSSLIIYNSYGKMVKALFKQTAMWDGKDNKGVNLPSGVYLIQIKADGQVYNSKVSLVR